jgi:hypothetical protein
MTRLDIQGDMLVVKVIGIDRVLTFEGQLQIPLSHIKAEVRRLEALGAQLQKRVEGWWVMLDPWGNEFCVVAAPGRFGWIAFRPPRALARWS